MLSNRFYLHFLFSLSELLPSHQQVGNTFTKEHAERRNTSSSSANRYRLPSPEKLDQKRPTDKKVAPDVIVEEIVEQQEYGRVVLSHFGVLLTDISPNLSCD